MLQELTVSLDAQSRVSQLNTTLTQLSAMAHSFGSCQGRSPLTVQHPNSFVTMIYRSHWAS
jgi:hypothetical protein